MFAQSIYCVVLIWKGQLLLFSNSNFDQFRGNSGCPKIEKGDKMNETGEYKIRPYSFPGPIDKSMCDEARGRDIGGKRYDTAAAKRLTIDTR
jgi:hypothetical protein